jgi:hypothetical protein
MTEINEIIELIKDHSGITEIIETSDIYSLGISGDDFHELIEKYAKMYKVEMSNYIWYFHADEEGNSIGGHFFAPPYERVERIPVTPMMLLQFANKGKWEISYPEHVIPSKRYDIIINRVIAACFLIIIIIWIIIKFIK